MYGPGGVGVGVAEGVEVGVGVEVGQQVVTPTQAVSEEG